MQNKTQLLDSRETETNCQLEKHMQRNANVNTITILNITVIAPE